MYAGGEVAGPGGKRVMNKLVINERRNMLVISPMRIQSVWCRMSQILL